MVVAAANFGSATGGLAAAGRSSIWAANGDLLIQLDDAGAGVAIATELAGGWRTKVTGLDSTQQHSIGEAAWR
jgi:predicted amidohydrolase